MNGISIKSVTFSKSVFLVVRKVFGTAAFIVADINVP